MGETYPERRVSCYLVAALGGGRGMAYGSASDAPCLRCWTSEGSLSGLKRSGMVASCPLKRGRRGRQVWGMCSLGAPTFQKGRKTSFVAHPECVLFTLVPIYELASRKR